MKKSFLIISLSLAVFAGCNNSTDDNTASEDTTTHVIMPKTDKEEVVEDKEIADPLNGWYEVVNDEYNFTAIFPKQPQSYNNTAEFTNSDFENELSYVYNDNNNNAYIIKIYNGIIDNSKSDNIIENAYLDNSEKEIAELSYAESTSFWGFPGANVQAITNLGFGITKKLIFVDNTFLIEITYFDKSNGGNKENADIFINSFNLSLK